MCFVVRYIVFIKIENSYRSAARCAVCAEAYAAVVAHLDAVSRCAYEVVVVVVSEECAHDVAVCDPCLIFTGLNVEILGARSFAEVALCYVCIEDIPLMISARVDSAVRFPVALGEERVDLLNGYMLEHERGNDLAAIESFKLCALCVVPFELVLVDAGVAAVCGVVGVHHVDVERNIGAVRAVNYHVISKRICAALYGNAVRIGGVYLEHLFLAHGFCAVMVVVAESDKERNVPVRKRLYDIVDSYFVVRF